MKKIVLTVIAGIFMLGCGQTHESMKTEHKGQMQEHHMDKSSTLDSSSEVVIRKAHKKEVGNPAACPVMGTKFNIKEATQVAVYKGKTYPFCCPGCSDPFKENPEEYIQ